MTAQPSANRRASLYELPHHDGSPVYLPEPAHDVGDRFDVFLRVPAGSAVSRVVVRQVHDGEPVAVPAVLDRTDTHGNRWFRAALTQANPVVPYRFLTDDGPLGYRWTTAAGPKSYDPNDRGDFVSSIHPGGPPWVSEAIAYQIFPDRFARSGKVREPMPSWADPQPWSDAAHVHGGPGGARVMLGGDLFGIAEHLDHISSLGADLLYLTPVFPAASNHRYNASTFDHVDPLLGGDEAYRQLIDVAHRRGMRVIGDLTTNHTGSTHEWFAAARSDPTADEAGFYLFTEHQDSYVGWMGNPSLPKLNYENPAVLRALVTGPRSPVRRYLGPDFGLDGWRIDVANMTARHGPTDRNREVAAAVRRTVAQARPEAYLVGEHFHDFLADLDGSGWQGVMNYAGFTKPLWTWLARSDMPVQDWMGIPWPGWPQLPGWSMVRAMQAFGSVGWQHRAASMNIVSSHDSPRIRTITGDARLVDVAVAAMFTLPGVPMIWAGDEIGQQGANGEEGRLPFPWDRPDTWDSATLSTYRELAGLRRTEVALRTGSLRWLYADDDRVAFLREGPAETVLVLLARSPGTPISLPSAALGLHDAAESVSLYPKGAQRLHGRTVRIPGDGPGAWIWRW